MALICKNCGYKQLDEDTIKEMKQRFPGIPEHDIPYYCGACQDTADEETYDDMVYEMEGDKDAPILIINTYRGLVDSAYVNFDLPEGIKIVIQDIEEDKPLIETEEMTSII